MKKYFAKYLPVPGKVKIGDNYTMTFTAEKVDVYQGVDYGPFDPVSMGAQRVKLFLCTPNTEIGDVVLTCQTKDDYWRNDPIKTNYPCKGIILEQGDLPAVWVIQFDGYTVPIPKNYCIKVLGEISSDALFYVKEGDEFDEDSVRFLYSAHTFFSGDGTENFIVSEEEWINEEIKPYGTTKKWLEIKGPCNHFH